MKRRHIGLLLVMLLTLSAGINAQSNATASESKSLVLNFHPALETFKLGAGIDVEYLTHFKPSAFIYTIDNTTHKSPKVRIQAQLEKVTEETSNDMSYDMRVEACMPFGDAGGKVEANIRSLNKNENVKLVFMTETEYEPDYPNDNKIELTADAKKLLGSPENFTETYGNYFCSAIFKGHRAKIEISLSRNLSSELNSYFQEGQASVNMRMIGVDMEMSIRSEIKKTAEKREADIYIDAYGGPEVKGYSDIIRNLLKSDSTYDGIILFLTGFMEKLDYSNAKIVKCHLSDYSSWGIPGTSLLSAVKIETQTELKKLYKLIAKEIESSKLILSNPGLNTNYSPVQIEKAGNNSIKLIELRNKIIAAHNRLNKGDLSLVGYELVAYKEFSDIKRSNPELFEFTVSRTPGEPVNFYRPPGLYNAGIGPLKSAILNTSVFNTFNSVNAFNNISRIAIVNNYTNKTISEMTINSIDKNIVPSGNNGVIYLPLAALMNEDKLTQVASAIDNDMMTIFRDYLMERHRIADKLSYQYNLVIVDKYSRKYSFSFYDVLFAANSPSQGFVGYIVHDLPENCCSFLRDYEPPEQVILGAQGPEVIFLNLKYFNTPFTDTLVIELLTDNPLVNQLLSQGNENILTYDQKDFADLAEFPVIPLSLLSSGYTFNEFVISWYSKNKRNEIDSKKNKVIFPYKRKLCSQNIYLKTE